jgi:hypothetical protein
MAGCQKSGCARLLVIRSARELTAAPKSATNGTRMNRFAAYFYFFFGFFGPERMGGCTNA